MRVPLLPLLLLLALPPLAAAAPYPVTATPAQVVLGRDKVVVVEVKAPRDTTPLRAMASTGSLMPLPATARGVYSYRWVPPDIRYPLLAVLAFWVDPPEGPPEVTTVHIPLLGRTVLNVVTDVGAGAQVVVQVADKSFGPVTTNRKGRAEVLVEVPPGVREALVLATAKGQQTRRTTLLDPPPERPLIALVSPDVIPVGGNGWLTLLGEGPDARRAGGCAGAGRRPGGAGPGRVPPEAGGRGERRRGGRPPQGRHRRGARHGPRCRPHHRRPRPSRRAAPGGASRREARARRGLEPVPEPAPAVPAPAGRRLLRGRRQPRAPGVRGPGLPPASARRPLHAGGGGGAATLDEPAEPAHGAPARLAGGGPAPAAVRARARLRAGAPVPSRPRRAPASCITTSASRAPPSTSRSSSRGTRSWASWRPRPTGASAR